MTGTTATWSNWAGNQHSTALLTVRPHSVSDVAEAVRQAAAAGRTVRATGSGHSFTATAVADGHRIDLAALETDVTVDVARRLVTVPAGMTLHTLNELLAGHGLAMPNLGDIDAQTIAVRCRQAPTAPGRNWAACPPSWPG